MRPTAIAAAGLAILLLACGGGGAGTPASPVGTWTIDVAAARPIVEAWVRKEAEAAPVAERAAARRQLEEVTGGILEKGVLRATFGADGNASFFVSRDGKETRLAGPWTERDGTVTVVATTRNGAAASARDARPVPFRHRDSRLWLEVQIGLEVPLRRE